MNRPALLLGLAVGAAAFAAPASAQNFNGTCTNVHYEGSRLVAVCLNALGVPQASSIEAGSCPPGAIGNSNGRLVCTAGGGGGGYGGGGYGGGGYDRGGYDRGGYRGGGDYGRGYDRPSYDSDDDDVPPPPRRYRYGY